ncbi:MAG: hypothetical protein PHY64_09480 [Eubacteriales bacterium]|nr:hypothetical protein [Eubacteriales bacterium]
MRNYFAPAKVLSIVKQQLFLSTVFLSRARLFGSHPFQNYQGLASKQARHCSGPQAVDKPYADTQAQFA